MSLKHKGKKLSIQHRLKISEAKKGIKMPQISGTKNYLWKGSKANYRSKHKWVERQLGKPHFCENCGRKDLSHRQYHWANISGFYKRIITDWRRLCVKCHKTFDRNRV